MCCGPQSISKFSPSITFGKRRRWARTHDPGLDLKRSNWSFLRSVRPYPAILGSWHARLTIRASRERFDPAFRSWLLQRPVTALPPAEISPWFRTEAEKL